MPKFDDYKNRYKHVQMERRDGILQAIFHTEGGPLKWGMSAHEELGYAFGEISRDEENKVVIITGTGDIYCSELDMGRNLAQMTTDRWDHVYKDAKHLLMNLLDIEVPVIAAVNGPALIHAEIPVLSDIVICSENAEFQDAPHFPNGVVPGDGVHVVWPLVLGANRGRYFLLTGQKLSAREALTLGVVSEIVARDKLLPRAWELAEQIAKRPRLASRYARVALTQPIKRAMLDNLGYGLALEEVGDVRSAAFPPPPIHARWHYAGPGVGRSANRRRKGRHCRRCRPLGRSRFAAYRLAGHRLRRWRRIACPAKRPARQRPAPRPNPVRRRHRRMQPPEPGR